MRRAFSIQKLATAARVLSLAMITALSLSAQRAEAQVRDVEPYHVIVTGERVYLRCGAGGVWYAIGYGNTGDVFRVDGEDFKWVRVGYPKGAAALVSIEEADYDRDRGVVIITRPSRLKAHNIHGQRFGDSWKNLLMQPINPGTQLKYVDTLRDANGQVEGYLVEPPAGSSAFISEQYTRRATPTEIAAWQAKNRPATEVATTETTTPTTAPTTTAQNEKTTGTTPPATTPDRTLADSTTATNDAVTPHEQRTTPPAARLQGDDTTKTADATTNPTEQAPVTNPVTQPRTTTELAERPPATTTGETTTNATPTDRRQADATNQPQEPVTTPATTPATTTPAATTTTAQAEPKAPTFEELESAFMALAEQSTEDAEIEALIAEYVRFRSTIDDTEENVTWRRRVDNRIAILEVRRELQANLQALNEANAKAGADASAMETRLAQLDQTRPYALVGRLTASAIYDGKRLPLMYRLQSVDAGGGRTIAYLVPNDSVDLKGRLGSIVGVDGASRVDPALKLRIVQPTRLDLLTPTLTRVDETSDLQ